MTDTLLRESNPPPGRTAVPKPQYWNPAANNGQGGWEVAEGEAGGIYVVRKTAKKQTAIIPAGQTVSNPIDISTAEHFAMVYPDDFTGDTIGYQVSDTVDGNYRELWSEHHRVYTNLNQAGIGALLGRAVTPGLTPDWLRPWQFLRIEAAEAQAEERVFEIHTK